LTTKNIIQSTDTSFKEDASYNHVLLWPSINNAIPAQAFPDWPEIKTEEGTFLMNNLKWKNPKIAGGITSEGNEKPDFVIYFDAVDEESPLNNVAQAAIDLLPVYEIGKVPELVTNVMIMPCIECLAARHFKVKIVQDIPLEVRLLQGIAILSVLPNNALLV
jgi:hypothetical protein